MGDRTRPVSGALWHDGGPLFHEWRRHAEVQASRREPARVHLGLASTGIDLVFEGDGAARDGSPDAGCGREGYNDGGWPATVEGDAFTAPFSAPSAGPPPWYGCTA